MARAAQQEITGQESDAVSDSGGWYCALRCAGLIVFEHDPTATTQIEGSAVVTNDNVRTRADRFSETGAELHRIGLVPTSLRASLVTTDACSFFLAFIPNQGTVSASNVYAARKDKAMDRRAFVRGLGAAISLGPAALTS
jgi:hypothetical protein